MGLAAQRSPPAGWMVTQSPSPLVAPETTPPNCVATDSTGSEPTVNSSLGAAAAAETAQSESSALTHTLMRSRRLWASGIGSSCRPDGGCSRYYAMPGEFESLGFADLS